MTLVRSYGDRHMARAHEIASRHQAKRILSGECGEGSSWLWVSLAQRLLSRLRWMKFWAEERGFVLHETSSEYEERYRTKLRASGGLCQSLADLRRRGLSAPRAMKDSSSGGAFRFLFCIITCRHVG